ncbi:MAG TPA: hypothetical protein VFV99_05945 [Kofleriaceae bacterium]|nr:hypothetical protein [Kofleriaceae bacterium]
MIRNGVMVVAAATLMGGCFSPGSSEENTSQMAFGLGGGDFAGNSVRICGQRQMAADSKYFCDSVLPGDSSSVEVPGPHPMEECPCFDFASDGTLVDPTTHAPVVINGLCPSIDLPHAPWRFDYTIYTQTSCHGSVLNTAANNFTCFDSKDLASQDHPNSSIERLYPGANDNHVLCTTENSSKTWEFESCAITTTSADEQACRTRYDCDCAPVNSHCACGGLVASDLEQGCHFEAGTCDILCNN